MKKSTLVACLLVVVLTWNLFTYVFVGMRTNVEVQFQGDDLAMRLNTLHNEIENHIEESEKLLQNLRSLESEKHLGNLKKESILLQKLSEDIENSKSKLKLPSASLANNVTIAVLVVACNRPDAIERSLNQILKYRTSEKLFPVIVSQDCGHMETAAKVQSFGNQVKLIQQPDQSEPNVPQNHNNFRGYYKIARHYKWMLSQVFNELNYDVVLIVEDDLDISPDFFEYFAATYSLLHNDPTLWCVSAWNDNGKGDLIENNPELLHRTDFFPGLGWMIEKQIWDEIGSKWPATFWDDWMRHPDQRRGRSCIRPEVSRTSTFGRIGVSKGQFFDKHLKFIKLNHEFVPFRSRDLSHLMQPVYDPRFMKTVYEAPVLTVEELLGDSKPETKVVRLQYNNKDSFKSIAKILAIMEDIKSGVPRTAYRGVVSLMFRGRRVYLAPPPGWNGYDTSWT